MKRTEIEWMPIGSVKPYDRNPRRNDDAVDAVANSIAEFGFKNPIIVDSDLVIIAGHTRLKAAKKLGLKEVPVVIASDLTAEQARAFRLVDNRTAELADWDDDLLQEELDALMDDFDMEDFGFEGSESADPMKKDIKPLKKDFIVPPFSILDTRSADWQARKKEWKSLGIADIDGREDGLTFNIELGGSTRGTSIFDPVLAEVLYHWFCPPGGTVVDPFAGGLPRGYVASVKGLSYTGMDLSETQVESNRAIYGKIPHGDGSAMWIQGDSRGIDHEIPEASADFMLTCPPYFDLEQYSDDPSDLSAMSYERFTEIYTEIIRKAATRVMDNRFAAVVISDVREQRGGGYRRLCSMTIDAMESAGFRLYNEMVLVECVGTRAYTARQNFRQRKINRTHQDVLVFWKGDIEDLHQRVMVFSKGDPEKIVKELGELNDAWADVIRDAVDEGASE